MSGVLELRGLSLERDGELLLESTDLVIAAGERLLITGPSGCGKSTLLRALCALDAGAETRVLYAGRSLAQWTPGELRRRVAYLPQIPVMVAGSVRDNLLLPLQLRVYRDLRIDEATLRAGLESLQLDLRLDMDAQKLSPGQKARLAFLQRQLLAPEVMLCDEPIAALDPDSAALLSAQLGRLGEAGVTQVIVSHQPLDALQGRRYRMHDRRLELQS